MPPELKNLDEKELLSRYYYDGNNDWLGELLQRYSLLLFGVCMKYLKNEAEAKDAVQQVFLKVISDLPKYKVEYFKSWLYMVAKNHCLMQLRGVKNTSEEFQDKHINRFADEDGIEAATEKEVQLNNMELAMKQLNEEQKQCIEMFYLQKLSYQQIADSTPFSIMQIKSHIQNGKRNLKILMTKMSQYG